MRGLLGAVQFLTRLPIHLRAAVPHDRIVPWFGVVGLLVGAAVGGVAVAAAELVPSPVAAGLAIAAGLLITGAFHEDGLADIADAFGGGWTRQQRFEILKDSRHGTYAVAAMSASILVRFASIASITQGAWLWISLVAAHGLARVAAVVAMAIFPPASESGLGADHARRLPPVATTVGAAVTVAAVAVGVGWGAIAMVAVAMVATLSVGLLAMRKIGGLAGDVLGAVEQVAECLVLVVATGLATRHGLWWD